MRKLVALLLCIFTIAAQASALAETQYDTGHFTIDIPDGWIRRDTEMYTYFYGKKSGSMDGGMLGIREIYLTASTNEDVIQSIYDSYAQGLEKSEACIGEAVAELIQIDGDTAVLVTFHQELNGIIEECYSVEYIVNGYAISAIYVNSTSSRDKEELLSLVATLRYKFAKTPRSTIFGKKLISVIGHEVIQQNGYDCLVVEYRWYHNESEPTAFLYSFSTEAYQRGVQCQSWILFGKDDNTTTKVEKGTYLTCYQVFILKDTTSPVKLYVDSIWDFQDQYPNLICDLDITR